jgi:hypothetical protein
MEVRVVDHPVGRGPIDHTARRAHRQRRVPRGPARSDPDAGLRGHPRRAMRRDACLHSSRGYDGMPARQSTPAGFELIATELQMEYPAKIDGATET